MHINFGWAESANFWCRFFLTLNLSATTWMFSTLPQHLSRTSKTLPYRTTCREQINCISAWNDISNILPCEPTILRLYLTSLWLWRCNFLLDLVLMTTLINWANLHSTNNSLLLFSIELIINYLNGLLQAIPILYLSANLDQILLTLYAWSKIAFVFWARLACLLSVPCTITCLGAA